MSSEDDVLFNSSNNVGVITLNRKKQMNALNLSMVTKILPVIRKWETEKGVIITKGGQHYCAGGDIKSVWEGDVGYRLPMFVYNVLNTISTSQLPYVAIMTGITMGGGLALAVFGRYRVATDDTVVAMPEVKVGMLPDAGASYFLPRLNYRLGYYLGLTGNSLEGKDVVRSGLATHYVPQHKIPKLEMCLMACNNEDDVKEVLEEFTELDDCLPLAENIKNIEHCFGGQCIEDILERLSEIGNDWSESTIESMMIVCPGSLKIALKSLQTGASLDVWQSLQMDFRLVYWSLRNHDFREGVRAILLEKDRKPKWIPKTLAQVTNEYVESFFKMLPEKQELYELHLTSKL